MNRRSFVAGVGSMLLLPGLATARQTTKKIIYERAYSTDISRVGSVFSYHWEHRGRLTRVHWDVGPFSVSGAQRHLKNLPHGENESRFIKMSESDPYRKQFIRPLVQAIVRKAAHLDTDPTSMFVSLVQGFHYTPRRNYQSWPTEVFLETEGDCSDTSVALAALLEQYQALDLNRVGKEPLWCFLLNDETSHMAVGIRDHGDRRYSGARWRATNGRRYFVAETTGTGFEIGELPPSLPTAKVVLPRPWS